MERNEQKSSFCDNVKNFVRISLTDRRLPVWLALLAIVLTFPSLNVGLLADDHWHRIAILGSENFGDMFGSPMDIFRFIDGEPQRTTRIMDIGVFPWWTYPKIKAAFWRPVTSLTHWLDYHLWPDFPALMHAQSILWFAALVGSVSLLYRRFMGVTFVAGLAALLYAIDDAHGQPVAWLANRNTILATLFGVLAVIAHDRWRKDRWRKGAVIGPLLLVISLLSAEAGITTCAFLLAYELFISDDTWSKRCKALIPYACVVVVWRIMWTYLGYGTDGIGIYDDPIRNPLCYFSSVVHRAPIFLLAQFAIPPAGITSIFTLKQYHLLWLAALIFLSLSILIMIPLLRRDRQSCFWTAATILSVLPICTTFPIDRLLLFVGIGAMGLLARFFAIVLGKSKCRPGYHAWRIGAVSMAVFLILIHLIIAPLALTIRAGLPMGPPKFVEQFYADSPLDDSIDNLESYLERNCIMEMWKKQPLGLVHSYISIEHSGNIANNLFSILPEKKEVGDKNGFDKMG